MEILTKTCSKCKTEKLTTEFNKSSRNIDGHYSSCKQCRKKWEIENRDIILLRKKQY